MNQDKYFRTNSFNVAVFLFTRGIALVNIVKTADPRRKSFVFLDFPEREWLLERFNFAKEDDPEVLVDARKMAKAMKALKEKLYQEEF